MSGELRLRAGRRTVEVRNPGKVLFPDDGITKGELAEYYLRVASWILPHLHGRPVTMERFPDGISGQRIVQKSVPEHFPDWIPRATVPKAGGTLEHVLCEDAATLVYLADQACVTPHVWLSRIDRPDHPDQMIFDLDPPGDDFGQVRVAALWLRSLLEEIRLPSNVKTTGGRGLHVIVPLDRRADFDTVREFARDVAAVLAGRHSERLTVEQRKNKRQGRIYLDTMRNAYAQTVAPPYAVRARPGATVATPLHWEEVEDTALRPGRFTMRTIHKRLEDGTDPWKGSGRRSRSLSRARDILDALVRETRRVERQAAGA
jgi:bifunctional non-homologous end joining protein LigD